MANAVLDPIRAFNRAGNPNTIVRKALDSATNSAGALIPESLQEVITNTVIQLSPEIAMISPDYESRKFYEYNKLVELPAAGGAMGERAKTPTSQSKYERAQVEMKIIRRRGEVTNFLQDASANYIDAAAQEMENHLLAHLYDLNYYLVHGNAGANAYEHSGLDVFVETNRTNEAEGGVVPSSLAFLDEMIDENTDRQGQNHKKCFLMSPQMLSFVSSLLTNVRLNQGLTAGGLTQVQINGGWILNAYRDIPIIPNGSMRPKITMGAVTHSVGGGGTIADGTYYIRVAVNTLKGESEASPEITVNVAGGGGVASIALTFAAVSGALSYKVFIGTSSGATFLRKQVSAFTYDVNGAPTGSITGITLLTVAIDTASVSAKRALDRPLVSTGSVQSEVVALWDLDEYQGLGRYGYTNSGGSKFNGLVTVKPLAEDDDYIPFLLKTYGALVPSFESTSFWRRGIRTA